MASSVVAVPAVVSSASVASSTSGTRAAWLPNQRALIGMAVLTAVTLLALQLAPPVPACSGAALTAATVALPQA